MPKLNLLAMAEEIYRSPPDEIGMIRAEQAIRRAGLTSLVATALAAALAYLLLPRIFAFPVELADRLAFAAQASVFVLIWVLIGVGMVSTARRHSPQDIGGSASGQPSERVAIYAAFLQNTLEQAVLAAGLYIALATLIAGAGLSLIVAGVALFAVGRVLFLRGYRGGAPGRALGMTLTMTPTVLGFVLVIVLIVLRLIGGASWV